MVKVSPSVYIAGILSVALAGAFFVWFGSERHIRNFPAMSQGPIVFFGDSLVAGVGAKEGNTLSDQLSRQLSEPIIPLGVPGDTTVDALERTETVVHLKPRLVILLLGGNDFLRKIDRGVTEKNLKTMIERFQEEGAIVLLLGVRSGILSGGSDELYERVAKETGAAYESDILKGVFGRPEFMYDTVHPNDAGYAEIADRLMPTIRKLLTQ